MKTTLIQQPGKPR